MLYGLSFLSLILAGAIFGFFYAWVCSTMWGLDAADPRVAINAMQAMNASVRNAVFAPAFFGTPVVLFLTAIVAAFEGNRAAAFAFAAAGLVYLLGGLALTVAVNVPMNEAIKYVGQLSRSEIKYEEHAVVVNPAPQATTPQSETSVSPDPQTSTFE